jgi:APA family basic amino acid/polyamine antiporter
MTAEVTDGPAPGARDDVRLPRVLGPVAAFCVVVGSVIGSGIFIVPAKVAQAIPAIGPILLAWVVGGIFSAAGALTLAELGAMIPQAGGPYAYLREAYGRLPAFLFGWAEFLINRTGSMATLAAAFARAFAQVVPAPAGIRSEVWQGGTAASAIAIVTLVNVLGTRMGGRLQVVGTALKVGGLLTLIALPFLIGGAGGSFLSGFMVAMVAILWAYDGWMNLTPLAEEVRDPGRNIPRALGLGIAVLASLYIGMTVLYHLVLPMDEIASAAGQKGVDKMVAAMYCKTLLGNNGVVAIALLVMCSTFISLNGNALTGPRSYFAMARDGLFFPGLCRIHPKYATPANAVIAQGTWSIGLTVFATLTILCPAPSAASGLPAPLLAGWQKLNQTPLYDVLFTYVIFGANVFYTLAIASVFVLRWRRPDAPRPYRTWGYPVTPLIFIVAALYLLQDMLRQSPVEALSGVAIILSGVPFYLWFEWTRRRSTIMEASA